MNTLNYSYLLESALTNKKYSQLDLFKSLDVISDGKKSNVYLRCEPIHEESFDGYFEDKTENSFFIYKFNGGLLTFKNQYKEFIDNYKQKNKKAVYATQLKMLYPRSMKTVKERKQFIYEFMHNIVNSNTKEINDKGKLVNKTTHVPYVVENIENEYAQTTYALITVIDRVYLGNYKHKRYRQTQYIDSRTKKFAKDTCPEEYKELSYKAGDFMLDKKGRKIKNDVLFGKRERFFAYPKNGWLNFINRLKRCVIAAFWKLRSNGFTEGKVLRKSQNLRHYPKVIRRRIGAINHAKIIVQYTINYLLKWEYEMNLVRKDKDWKLEKLNSTVAYQQLEKIFEHYKARFKNQYFHDKDGKKRYIQYYKQRVNDLENNIEILIRMFFEEIENVQLTL
ncbi:hypothetical protein EDD63_11641 [Breznakia blatticola]|uniref:Uncharacterized protein n=1 Tax=Breznakia blatticola TaxID=1754012 RepID=A0A4R7ZPT7_9FIRM|nr:hypothetical protein [Breznakia blatticola]TDW19939.1 hypothetical protein EDD63_11641 [Breznakia blatticola]